MNESPKVDLRCPDHPIRLFGRLLLDPHGRPWGVEVACRDCRQTGETLVTHIYSLTTGDVVATGRHV